MKPTLMLPLLFGTFCATAAVAQQDQVVTFNQTADFYRAFNVPADAQGTKRFVGEGTLACEVVDATQAYCSVYPHVYARIPADLVTTASPLKLTGALAQTLARQMPGGDRSGKPAFVGRFFIEASLRTPTSEVRFQYPVSESRTYSFQGPVAQDLYDRLTVPAADGTKELNATVRADCERQPSSLPTAANALFLPRAFCVVRAASVVQFVLEGAAGHTLFASLPEPDADHKTHEGRMSTRCTIRGANAPVCTVTYLD